MQNYIALRAAAAAQVYREANYLAQQIDAAIQPVLEAHRQRAGWSPAAIDVQMLETTQLTDSRPRHILGRVRVTPPADREDIR